jgi:hypothetical protein
LPWDSSLNQVPIPSSYKFEKWWLLREDFSELVTKNWNSPTKSKTAIDTWQEKVRRFRKTTKGWSSNIEADLRQMKSEMMEEYDTLDIKAESSALSNSELYRLKFIQLEMQKLGSRKKSKLSNILEIETLLKETGIRPTSMQLQIREGGKPTSTLLRALIDHLMI